MPFKSEAQRRWMWANDKEMAKRWEAHTTDKNLPEKVSKQTKEGKLHEYLKKHRK